MNCHGCKYLDRYNENGNGYCSMVCRSSQRNNYTVSSHGEYISPKVRRPYMERCELYESGLFSERLN